VPTYPYGLPQSYTFSDPRGFKAVTRMFINSTQSVANNEGNALKIAQALAGVSRTATVNDEGGTTTCVKSNGVYTTPTQPYIAATSGPYDSIADKLVLIFNDAAGRPHKYQIPCPLETIFNTDNVQVLASDAAVALLCSQMLAADTNGGTHTTTAAVVSAQGQPLVAFASGYRSRSQTPRRMNTNLRQADGNADIWP
jgi:hypothetical protein